MTEIKALECLKACLECGDCLTCNKHDEAIEVAINALQEKIEREQNISLTIEELKQTINEPIWIKYHNKCGFWDIIQCFETDKFYPIGKFYGLRCSYWADEYGEKWSAYRYKKEN